MKDIELLDNSYFNILDNIREHKWSHVLNRFVYTFDFIDLLLFDLHFTSINFQTSSIFNILNRIFDWEFRLQYFI